jgi:hypothetical protein
MLSYPPYVDQWYGWWVTVYASGAEYSVSDAVGVSYYYSWIYILPSGQESGEAVVEQVPIAPMLPAMTDPLTDRPIRRPPQVSP